MSKWTVAYDEEFHAEVEGYAEAVQVKIAAAAHVLAEFGPRLGRPLVDTLKGSRHVNMKELRFKVGRQVWRVAFAFDPARQAILLVGGDKQGVAESQFYARLIRIADARFDRYLAQQG